MINELKFVKGAVSKHMLTPVFNHFRIRDGFITSYNGTLALGSPIDLDLDCSPQALPMVKAIDHCKGETVSLSLTKAGRLSIKSGKFKAFIPCVDDGQLDLEPEGEIVEVDGVAILKALKVLKPFISDNPIQPWSNGVLLDGTTALVTNNVIIVEHWVGNGFPFKCNIPSDTVKEMVRINEAPISAQVSDTSLTFHYNEGKWLRTSLLDLGWPDVDGLLNRESNPVKIDPEFFVALQTIKPLTDDLRRVFFKDGAVTTSLTEGEGASYEVDDVIFMDAIFQIDNLDKLKDIVLTADFSSYPAPCMFFGDQLRGAIMGMRS